MKAIIETVAGNPQNQDRGAVFDFDSKMVLVVADGAGGLSGGTEAAAMAVDFVGQQASGLDGPDSCVTLLHNADRLIAQDKVAGETTCTVAVIAGEDVYGASVGDSAAWLIGGNSATDLTRRQVRKPFLGTGCASPVAFSHKFVSADKLLLATDGLFKYTSPERIETICRLAAHEAVATELVELVRYKSGALPDDITVIFIALEFANSLIH